ncbi:MAG: argininosuccinate lyase, partial [Thermomonas sp.]
FREAYKAAAADAEAAGQGRTPEGSLAARTSPGAAADLRLQALRARWEAAA